MNAYIAVFDDLGHPIAAMCIAGGDEMKLDHSHDSFLRHIFSGKFPLNTAITTQGLTPENRPNLLLDKKRGAPKRALSSHS